MISVYVVNLDRSAERWTSVAQSAEATTIRLVRIAAIDGQQLSNAERSKGLDEPKFEVQHGRKVLPGEIGCYQSHLLALDAVIASGDDLAIIAEDDILLNDRLEERVRALFEACPDMELLRLVSHRFSGFVRYGSSKLGDQYGRCFHGPQGSAACYAVTREGAIKLREALATMSLPYDIALESGWDTHVATYTTAELFVDFNNAAGGTTIGAPSHYRKVKRAPLRQLDTFLFRAFGYTSRMSYSLQTPAVAKALSRITPPRFFWPMVALMLVLVSATWVETDAYRYAALLIFFVGIIPWLFESPRASVGFVGYACIVWAVYVLMRMFIGVASTGGAEFGSAEGIYLFPALYSCMGYAVARYHKALVQGVGPFILTSLAALAATVPFSQEFDGRFSFLFMNNTIHSSVGGGFILIAAINFAAWAISHIDEKRSRIAWIGAASLTALLAAIGLVAAESKGVWLALAAATAVQLFAPVVIGGRRSVIVASAGLIAAAALAATVFAPQSAWEIINPSMSATGNLVEEITDGGGLVDAMQSIESAATTPASMSERLVLWTNAVETWQQRPIFGHGILWEQAFRNAHYKDVPYNLLHNGYLEIAVRFGLVGVALFLALNAYLVSRSWRAYRQGLIPAEAFCFHLVATVFFLGTLLTNSNNRLAIGESFMMASATFGFYCHFRMQPMVREARTFPYLSLGKSKRRQRASA